MGITAKIAHKVAQAKCSDDREKRMQFIMRQIEKEAENGKFHYDAAGGVDDEMKKELEELGYTVTIGYNGLGYRIAEISWRDAV